MNMPEFDDVPVNRKLGFRLIERNQDGAVVEMSAADEFLQETGVIHGGIITALADTAAVYCLLPHLDSGSSMTGIELNISFLCPAIAGAAPLTARGSVVRSGRRIGVCTVDVRQGERHIAHGTFTYMFQAVKREQDS
jgi:uncharacterized protein (TIGR00369 family)